MSAKSRRNGLYQLTIGLGASAPHFTEQKFRRQTAHIALMFLRYLTQVHKYVLDGSTQLFVYFGLPEPQRAMLGPKYYFRESQGNWSSCCIPKFDLQAFSALSESEQDERTTALLEKALLAVAKQVAADGKPIRQAAKMVRTGNYSARFPIPRLTCKNPAGDRTARVWSCISRGIIRWQVCLEDAEGQVLRSEWIPDDCCRFPDFTEDGLLPRWDKQGFTLRNEKGRIRYTLPAESAEQLK